MLLQLIKISSFLDDQELILHFLAFLLVDELLWKAGWQVGQYHSPFGVAVTPTHG